MKDLKRRIVLAEKAMPYARGPTCRQPVHTVYGGAHLFKAETLEKLGREALSVFERFVPDAETLERGLTGEVRNRVLWSTVRERVHGKLRDEPVEDFRIDFEDGYGPRSDAEEDAHAQAAGRACLTGKLSPFIGIRIKPFNATCFDRSVRTLDIFLKEVWRKLPPNFVVTLPKVTSRLQIEMLEKVLGRLEKKYRLPRLRFEFMVETTQSLLGPDGRSVLMDFVKAGKGRCVGAHLGTYDYTASHDIIASHQNMLHPACSFAKQWMKVALSQTGVFLSDGATNVIPVTPHRGENSQKEREENHQAIYSAWRVSYAAIFHSLQTGFYQGWDLHPAQLPVRFAAVYYFFLESLAVSTERLRGFVDKAARATCLGNIFDDAATGQGLLNYFLRGRSCGALLESELLATGLRPEEIELRNFQSILTVRAQKEQTQARSSQPISA